MVDQATVRQKAKEIVAREDVKCLLGWRKGTFGYRVSPYWVESPEDAEELIFSPFCSPNLTNYLTLEEKLPLPKGEEPDKRKTALLVKGCDSKAAVQLLTEKGIEREQIILLGVPCRGVIDQRKLEEKYPEGSAGVDAEWNENKIKLNFPDGVKELDREELLADNCLYCRHPNPVLADETLGKEVEAWGDGNDPCVEELEQSSPEDKWAFWEKEFSRCLRCYSCRNACPMCYCEDCVLDRLNPTLVYRSVNYSENTAFHIARAFHLVGRCVSCGECERVCPAGIPLGRLNQKLVKEVREKYGFEAGTDPEAVPFQASYNPQDQEDFIL